MRKKIGIVLWAHPHYGGVFQYSLSVINAITALDRDLYEVTIFYRHKAWHKYMHEVKGNNVSWLRYHANIPLIILGLTCRIAERHRVLLKLFRLLHPIYYMVKSRHIDLMVYPAPIAISFEMGIPYIIAVHDLQHRLHPEFPEVSAYGEWNRREYLFRNCSRHAAAVLVESETGKDDLLRFYEVKKDNVHILPYVAPFHLMNAKGSDVVKKFGLPDRYLFYPAQFWDHKNHVRLVEALHTIKRERGLEIPVVLVGAKKNSYRKTMMRVAELGMESQVIYPGYVSDEDIVGLYRTAQALVMPTFFGPSNIPQLEAFLLGCPVITSDIPGIYEQVGDAAVLVAPDSVSSIADGIVKVWCDAEFRLELVQRGYARVASWTPGQFGAKLRAICEQTISRGLGA